jgi:hypothetical protein
MSESSPTSMSSSLLTSTLWLQKYAKRGPFSGRVKRARIESWCVRTPPENGGPLLPGGSDSNSLRHSKRYGNDLPENGPLFNPLEHEPVVA